MTDSLERIAAALERLVLLMEQDADERDVQPVRPPRKVLVRGKEQRAA